MRTALTFFSAFLLMGAATLPASADEIRVLTGNAVQTPQRLLAQKFSQNTGHTVTLTSANPSVIQQKLDAGEPFELLVIPSQFLKAYQGKGKVIDGSARPLARVGVGVAAREGNKLDFATPEAFKAMVKAAHKIAYSDASTGGLSALSVQQVLKNAGLADVATAKAVTGNNGHELVASGQVDFGLYNVSEIPRAKGEVLAGRVPAALQAYLDYDAAIPKSNTKPEAARAFLTYMASPDGHSAWESSNIDQAR
ncbi:MAG TPA: substrate-binding domain-containing protein [Alphaproteobacteria bacterium]|nr:substrate-binding domain-containing protein [Alphaproteobacteria bacterium]